LTSAHIKDLVALSISFILEIWLVILLVRRTARRHFPIFFAFAVYTLILTVVRLGTLSHYRAYFFSYWWTEAGFAFLSLAALHEVFYWMFEGFYRVWWFRVFYYGTITIVVGVAVRNAIVTPPVQAHPVISLILDVVIGVNFIRMGIVSLFFVLKQLLVVEHRRYADGIVIGFGISSAGPLMGYLARSEFGTKLENFAIYSAAVAYILGVAVWVAAFIRPERDEGEWEPPMSPERMLAEAQSYLKALGISRKKR
jgi:hypothetical protein